ncbi:Hypothetical protein NTJ_05681 [Nesidiocoris tenuis]|uniref:Uncharacterized protein n=1 Tax=Nesidiocoris tenuis TaxID=355587 RepID=A0ABN7AR83_9HEMI|nr:Hypothetical protein NTJ_05681 [Nesidiocoris tenuis]
MLFVKLCVLIGLATIGSAGRLRPPSTSTHKAHARNDRKLLKRSLNFAEELVDYSYFVASNGTADATQAVHVAIENASNFGLAAVTGGTKITNEGLDLLKRIFRYWPTDKNAFNSASESLTTLLGKLNKVALESAKAARKVDEILLDTNEKVQEIAGNLKLVADTSIRAGQTLVHAVEGIRGIHQVYKKFIQRLTKGDDDDRSH